MTDIYCGICVREQTLHDCQKTRTVHENTADAGALLLYCCNIEVLHERIVNDISISYVPYKLPDVP